MKRICMIIPGRLPVPAVLGGAVETLVNHIIDINEEKKQFELTIICPYNRDAELKSREYKCCTFKFINSNIVIKKIINGINYLIIRWFHIIDFFPTEFHVKIRKILLAEEFDAVIIEHAIYKHFYFLKKRYNRNQLYLHLHGVVLNPDLNTQKLFGNIISVSNYISDTWKNQAHYRSQHSVCYNGVDERNFIKRIEKEERNAIRNKFGVNNADFLIIYCGRLIEIKGVKELITSILNINNDKIKLMIVGAPNFKESTKTKYLSDIDQLVDGKRCFFTGFIDNDQLYKYYQSADLQVVPSLCEEGASLVSIEGMMSGLPLIVTNSGGITEYVNKDNAIIIDKGDSLYNNEDRLHLIENISKIVEELYDNKEKLEKMSLSGIKNSNKFTREEMYNSFVGCIH